MSSFPVVPLPEVGKGVRAAGGAGAGPESDTLWCEDSSCILGILRSEGFQLNEP